MSSNYKCCVAFFKNNRYNVKKVGVNVCFHKFPEGKETKQKWIAFCQREISWIPSSSNVVCSQHFLPSDYQLSSSHNTKRGANWLNPQGETLSNQTMLFLYTDINSILAVPSILLHQDTGLNLSQFNEHQQNNNNDESSRAELYFSQRAHRYIGDDMKIPVPVPRTLQRYSSKIDLKQGTPEDILKFIGSYSQTLKPMDRECVLSFDEMKVSRVLEYDPSADEIVGPFNYLQVVMMRGLFKQWKQPIFIGFDTKMTKDIIIEIISRLSEKDINVVATISDNCQTNIGCWKELGARDDVEKPYFPHPKTNKNVYVIPDTPHLLKLLRNWLLDHGFEYNGQLIETTNLLRMVAKRMESEMTPLFKLTTSHIDMTPQERQNVRIAAELLSRTTAVALRTYFPDDDDAKILANFIDKVDVWFSISNSYTSFAKLDFKKAYTASDDQVSALTDMYDIISNMTIPGKNGLQIFQRPIMMQIKSLQMVFVPICTHKLNQDVLKNFFSQLRQIGGVYDHPSPLSCIYRIRLMILGKTPTILHNQTTTAEAANVSKMNSLQQLRAMLLVLGAEITPELPDVKAMEEANNFVSQDVRSFSSVSDTSIELPHQEADGLSYILGYLAKKHHSQFSHLNLGEHTFKTRIDHNCCQPPTFVHHLSCGGLIEPSDEFLNLGEKMEKICLKMKPDGGLLRGERIVDRIMNKIKRHLTELPVEIIRSFAKQRVIVRMRYLNLKATAEQLNKMKHKKRKFVTENTKAAKKKKKIIN
uniref:Uncharacterized protein n=1 Tax=Anopheles arabiensis TaxID=7173 RepID=A0A182I0K0_ANOAR